MWGSMPRGGTERPYTPWSESQVSLCSQLAMNLKPTELLNSECVESLIGCRSLLASQPPIIPGPLPVVDEGILSVDWDCVGAALEWLPLHEVTRKHIHNRSP